MRNVKTRLALGVFLSGVVAVGVRAHYKTPLCRVINLQSPYGNFQYWVSPFITNGNGKTHICANLYASDSHPEWWAVELPLKGHTIVSYPMTKESALQFIGDHCRLGI